MLPVIKKSWQKSSKRLAFAISAVTLSAASSLSYAVVPELQQSSVAPVHQAQSMTNRIIVKYKDSSALATAETMSTARFNRMGRATGTSFKHMRRLSTGAQLIEMNDFKSQKDINSIISEIMTDPNVEYAEPDLMMHPLAIPTDPRYNEQWHYFETTGGLNLPTAWDTSTGSGAIVGVIDTGYRPHADLVANILPGYDMISDATVARDGNGRDNNALDEGDWTAAGACGPGSRASDSSWHGTHVAGTVGAVANNGIGVAGVAYNAQIVPIRALGRCGGFTSDIADGIIWGAGGSVSGIPTNANPAHVLNLSLGGTGACSATTQAAINTARSLGTTVVVAAGNSNVNASNANPANCNGVITVAATNRNGSKAFYSNFGNVVDVSAPGGETTVTSNGVLSTLNTGTTTPGADTYAFYQGTSMATPHVAGAAALLYSVNPNITPDEVESILTSTARSFPGTCSGCGVGIVDAAAAVELASGGSTGGGSVLTNGVAITGLSGATGTEIRYTLEVPAGATDLSFTMAGGTGDADLYVRYASAPTTSTFDCRPFLNGNNETCNITNVQAGTYHVMVRAFSTFSGVSLTGSFTDPSSGPVGISESNLSASSGTWRHFTIDVPAGASSLDANMSGGTGDADLYVRFGSEPTTSSFQCRPFLNGNNESCSVSSPTAGTWYVSIRAFSTYSGVNLEADVN
ncbi:S8 family peptidase [Sessilibacter corallicola]|uniref:S8 family peptidase n=1 Tax=Sessilibacter corallicola TaxID=2904075 RepID=A0ABQ0AEB5_9GAMM